MNYKRPQPLALDIKALLPSAAKVIAVGAFLWKSSGGVFVALEENLPKPPPSHVLNGARFVELAKDAGLLDPQTATLFTEGFDYRAPWPAQETQPVMYLCAPQEDIFAPRHNDELRFAGYRIPLAMSKLNKAFRRGVMRSSPFLPCLPYFAAPAGTTEKDEGVRCIQDLGGPRSVVYTLPSRLLVLSLNDSVPKLTAWQKQDPSRQQEHPHRKEVKPSPVDASRIIAIFKHAADLDDSVPFLISADMSAWFWQLAMLARNYPRNSFIFPDELGDFYFCISMVALMGASPSTTFSQLAADILCDLWFLAVQEFEKTAATHDSAHIRSWVRQREQVFGPLTDVPCFNRRLRSSAAAQVLPFSCGMYTDDALAVVLGAVRTAHAMLAFIQLCDFLNAIIAEPKFEGGFSVQWLGVRFTPSLGVAMLAPRKTALAAERIALLLQGRLSVAEYTKLRGFMVHVAFVLRAFDIAMTVVPTCFMEGADPAGLIKPKQLTLEQRQGFQQWHRALLAGPVESCLAAFDERLAHLLPRPPPARYCFTIFSDACYEPRSQEFGLGGSCGPGMVWAITRDDFVRAGIALPGPSSAPANIVVYEAVAAIVCLEMALFYIPEDVNVVLASDAVGVPLSFAKFDLPTSSGSSPFDIAKRIFFSRLANRKMLTRVENYFFVAHIVGIANALGDLPSRSRSDLVFSLGKTLGSEFRVVHPSKQVLRFVAHTLSAILGVPHTEDHEQLHPTGIDLHHASQASPPSPFAQASRPDMLPSGFRYNPGAAAQLRRTAAVDMRRSQVQRAGGEEGGVMAVATERATLTTPARAVHTRGNSRMVLRSTTEGAGTADWPALSQELLIAKMPWLVELIQARAATLRAAVPHTARGSPVPLEAFLNILSRSFRSAGHDARLQWSSRWRRFASSADKLGFDPAELVLNPQRYEALGTSLGVVFALLFEDIFWAMVPRDSTRQCVKPASTLSCLSTIVRIQRLLLINVDSPLKQTVSVQKALSLEYMRMHGPVVAVPLKREPILPPLGKLLLRVAATRVKWSGRSSTVWVALIHLSLQAGFRGAEIAFSASRCKENTLFRWSFVQFSIGGTTISSPTAEQLSSVTNADFVLVTPAPSKKDTHNSVWGAYKLCLPVRRDHEINAAGALIDWYAELLREKGAVPLEDHVFDGIATRDMRSQLHVFLKHPLVKLHKEKLRFYSWHSFRRGLLLALLSVGTPVEVVLRHLRWSAKETLHLYGVESAETVANLLTRIQDAAPTTARVSEYSVQWDLDAIHPPREVEGAEPQPEEAEDTEESSPEAAHVMIDMLSAVPDTAASQIPAVSAAAVYETLQKVFHEDPVD